ncbi:MAG TPA: IS701 family transposase [Gammaproteobacteria bacterium]
MSKPKLSEFDRYLKHLCEGLGHADRHAPFMDYSRGLMLPIERKSVEPLAAHTDPWHVSSKHQSLHHFVADSAWSDEAVIGRVREWVTLGMGLEDGCYWILDDTGFPKKGQHSVGVAHQYCGQLGKQANCQVAVSLSLASRRGSIPIAWRLYLPESWANDAERRRCGGVPEEIKFATKPQIALKQIRAAKNTGVPVGVVLADPAYGNDSGFREALSALELSYCVGVQSSTTVWEPGRGPLPAKAKTEGRGRQAERLRRDPRHPPLSLKELALALPAQAWQTVSWREGTNKRLRSRFAAVRVRPAHRDYLRRTPHAEQWALIEWPNGDAEPLKYWLATLPAATPLTELVHTAKMRWRIERDYQELKQEFGLNHYEGRGWRGFHHHATLCIAAYGFLLAHRLKRSGGKKNSARPKMPRLPDDYTPRGSGTGSASRTGFDRDATLSHRARARTTSRSMSVLRSAESRSEVVTQ